MDVVKVVRTSQKSRLLLWPPQTDLPDLEHNRQPPKGLKLANARAHDTAIIRTTVASMPMQLSGAERVEHRALSLPPNFPRTGGTPHSNILTTHQLSNGQLHPPWQLLVVPSHPTRGRTEV